MIQLRKICRTPALRHCLLLAGILGTVVLVIVLTHPDCVYGSRTDWSNQHFAIPEYFRTRFYATGDWFPNFAMHLGGGQNIYYFAYYGLYSPVLLPAYLMPWLSMAAYLQIAGVLLTYISAVLCYFWLRRWFTPSMACFLAVLFLLSAPVIFNSHHHTMYVSYLPFLFWALLSVHAMGSRRFSAGLVCAAACILLTSFYFSPGAFLAILLYGAFYVLESAPEQSVRQVLGRLGTLGLHLLLAAMIAGILLIPTALTLFTGRDASAHSQNLGEILLPRVQLGSLLYSPFSAGMTSVSLLAAVGLVQLRRKSLRLLAGTVLTVVCLPMVLYLLNGTMYLEAKALIPFLPLLLLLCGQFFIRFFGGEIRHRRTWLIFTALLILGLCFSTSTTTEWIAAALEGGVMVLVFAFAAKPIRRRLFFAQILLFSTAVCLAVNLGDTYMKKTDVDGFYSKSVTRLVQAAAQRDDSLFRISSEYHAGDTVNQVCTGDMYRTSVYSSVHNTTYSRFFFQWLGNENSIRNAAMMVQSRNPVFGILMGEKYLITKEPTSRYGMELIAEDGELKLYENTLACPVGYATSYTASQSCFTEAGYPYQLETLLKNAVTEDDTAAPGTSTRASSETHRVHPSYKLSAVDPDKLTAVGDGWYIHSRENFTVTVTLDTPVNDLIFLKLHVNNHLGNGSATGDVSITVNGIRNKLTDPAWKYQNNNFDFRYTLSSAKPVTQLQLTFSAGDYVVTQAAMYQMPYRVLQQAADAAVPWEVRHADAGGDTLTGNISVDKDSYFVLSMPYDKGFAITVDGQPVSYACADGGLIGFPLAAGRHTITVRYTAPGFTAGVLCSVCGVLLLVGMMIFVKKSKKPLTSNLKCAIL